MGASSRHHWVIGDVHGCHESLDRLLSVLPSSDHLVFCGDVINRGPAIEAAMNRVWDLVCVGRATWLRGNHEQALIDVFSSPDADHQSSRWQTDTVHQLGEELCQRWLARLIQLPLIYQSQGWCATHAGFTSGGELDFSIRDAFWENYQGSFGRVLVGHTPRPAVERHRWIVLIDTGAVYGGALSAFCPETDAVVQVHGASGAAAAPRSDSPNSVPSVVMRDQIPC